MASLGNYAGTELVEGSAEFDPIPAGVYDMEVSESAVVPTKSGNGTILKLTLKVTSGEFENRLVWANLNIDNPSEEARKNARRHLSDLCRACGMVSVPGDSEEFHGIPIRVNVKWKAGDGQYGPKNEIGKFIAADDAPAAPARQNAAARPAAQPSRANPAPSVSGRGPAPWKKTA